jgi:hypothetical protein
MRRLYLLLAWLAVLSGAVAATAQELSDFAPQTTHYRFLRRFSVLNETGGIYPRDIDYRVLGTFDLITSGPADFRYDLATAQFDNVDAWASHPILAYVLPLDQVLNLSGLSGRQLPVAAPFNVYGFRGETADGSAVRLLAAEIGPWLWLRGQTTPPPNGADYLAYSLRAVARRTPNADFDANDVVDAADLERWRQRFGASSSLAEADYDQVVDGADFLAWQQQLSENAPSPELLDAMTNAALATLTSSVAPAPEPVSLQLVAVGLAMLARTARRR